MSRRLKSSFRSLRTIRATRCPTVGVVSLAATEMLLRLANFRELRQDFSERSLTYGYDAELGWFPVQGYTPIARGIGPWLENLVLPAIALGCVYIALIARITRATMLDVLQQDYVRTAKAKGLGQNAILFIHALKNASVPIITVIGIGIALLIGGAVVTESVFAIPGLGRLTLDAILRRDYPVIQGVVLMFSFVYVLVNLVVDLIYTLVDPRIRY